LAKPQSLVTNLINKKLIQKYNQMKNKKVKKLVNKGAILPKSFGQDNPICLTLCLGKIEDGLHIEFIVTKTGNKYGSQALLTLHDEPIAIYGLEWAELPFWLAMERFSHIQSELIIAPPKK